MECLPFLTKRQKLCDKGRARIFENLHLFTFLRAHPAERFFALDCAASAQSRANPFGRSGGVGRDHFQPHNRQRFASRNFAKPHCSACRTGSRQSGEFLNQSIPRNLRKRRLLRQLWTEFIVEITEVFVSVTVHRQVKFIWLFLLTGTSFALSATLVTKSGTIVIFGLSQNEIVVAADSRGNAGKNNPGKYDDHECKIIALSDKFVFAFSGMGDFSGPTGTHPSDIIEMHVGEQAKIAFNSTPNNTPDFLARVGFNWARNVQSIFRNAIAKAGPDEIFGGSPEGPVTNGYFFGLSPNGILVFYEQIIYRQGNDVVFDGRTHSAILTDEMTYNGSGITDITGELLTNKTRWAKKESTDWERKSLKLPKADRDVLKAVRWVQLTIDRHPGSREIGGPIDSLTFTPTKGVHWHSQKCECRDNRHHN
jgi:hypothetical protein